MTCRSQTHLLQWEELQVIFTHVPKHVPVHVCAARIPRDGWGWGWRGSFGEQGLDPREQGLGPGVRLLSFLRFGLHVRTLSSNAWREICLPATMWEGHLVDLGPGDDEVTEALVT